MFYRCYLDTKFPDIAESVYCLMPSQITPHSHTEYKQSNGNACKGRAHNSGDRKFGAESVAKMWPEPFEILNRSRKL